MFTNSFDGQLPGPVTFGYYENEWSGVKTPADLSVENSYVNSAANALQVNTAGAQTSYVYEWYPTTYVTHSLTFAMAIGSHFTLPTNEYLSFASTETARGKLGLVELSMSGSRQLYLTYYDSTLVQHNIWTNFKLQNGQGYWITLAQTAGATAGQISVTVNGTTIINLAGIDTGSTGVRLFNLGLVYTPVDAGTSGSLYYDDVSSTYSGAQPPT